MNDHAFFSDVFLLAHSFLLLFCLSFKPNVFLSKRIIFHFIALRRRWRLSNLFFNSFFLSLKRKRREKKSNEDAVCGMHLFWKMSRCKKGIEGKICKDKMLMFWEREIDQLYLNQSCEWNIEHKHFYTHHLSLKADSYLLWLCAHPRKCEFGFKRSYVYTSLKQIPIKTSNAEVQYGFALRCHLHTTHSDKWAMRTQ